MALIKCKECGKEFSDMANACPNCACPTIAQTKEKKATNKFIIKSQRDKSLQIFKKIYSWLTIIVAILIAWFLLSTKQIESPQFLFEILWIIIIVGIPCEIFYLICNTIYNNAKKSSITLNEKELYGEIYALFNFVNISFPIEKISSINYFKIFGFINGIMIVPTNGRPQRILFIDNGNEFRQAILNQAINK